MVNLPNFIVIEKDLLLDKSLNSSTKILYALISTLANNKDKVCYASNKYLASLLGYDIRSIQRMINDLINGDYIQVYYKKNNRIIKPQILEPMHIRELKKQFGDIDIEELLF